MALNQTQRKHAIEMIKNKLDEKFFEIRIAKINETDFIISHLQYLSKKKAKIPVEDILSAYTKDRWNCNSLKMLKALKIESDYEKHEEMVEEYNKNAMAAKQALEQELVNGIMFGTDVSIIADALEKIVNFKA